MAILKIPYKPHKGQKKFHQSKAKFRGLLTGVAYGKTAAGANEILKMAVKYPKSKFLVMAPNSKILNHATLPEIYKWGRKLIVSETKSKNTIHILGGGTIIYLTADNMRHVDRLRGMTIGGFWLDEASLFLRMVWAVILARLRCNHGPLKGVITTTPKGFNWLYWYFVKGTNPVNKKKLRNADSYWWIGGTTHDNPYTPEEFKQTLMDDYTGIFKRQEIYGEFTGFEGQVYPQFKHNTHILEKYPEPGRIRDVIAGVDWGFTNPMAGLIIGFDNDGRSYVLEEFYRTGQKVSNLIDWLHEQKEKYPLLRRVYADPAEPQFIMEVNEARYECIAADNSVLPGINKVYDYVEIAGDGLPRLFVMKHCQGTIDEFSTYHFPESKDGVPKQDKPLKVDDHCMDALRYALKSHAYGKKSHTILSDKDGSIL